MDRSKVDPQIVKAAEGMEAMFLDYMMKVMRETVPRSELSLDSHATDIYRSMLDSETAKTAARTGGVGLADQIIAYLQAQSYTANRGSTETGAPANRVHAGQKAGAAAAVRGVTRAPEKNTETSTGGTDESWTDKH